jgi:hypothetical protein
MLFYLHLETVFVVVSLDPSLKVTVICEKVLQIIFIYNSIHAGFFFQKKSKGNLNVVIDFLCYKC